MVAAGPDAQGLSNDRELPGLSVDRLRQMRTVPGRVENHCSAGLPGPCIAPAVTPTTSWCHTPGNTLIDIGDLESAQIAPYACFRAATTYSALKKIGADIYREHPVVIFGASRPGADEPDADQGAGRRGRHRGRHRPRQARGRIGSRRTRRD